jgi:hypothetical protein
VETISIRSFWGSLINMLEISVKGLSNWALEHFSVNEWEELNVIEEIILHNRVEIGSAKNSIPIISNVTTIHDLTEDVFKILPRNLTTTACLSLKIVVEYNRGISEITSREWISSVPSLCSETSPFKHARVEVAKTEQDSSNFAVFLVEVFWDE